MDSRFLLAVLATVVSLAIGYFLGMAAAEGTHAEEWAYRYQTLVAGVLAVVAAALTIIQMQKVDDRQQRRHAELIKLNLRSDRLRVLRAQDGPALSFRLLAERLGSSIDEVERLRKNRPVPSVDIVNSELENLSAAVASLSTLAKSSYILEAKDLFNPAMYTRHMRMIRRSAGPSAIEIRSMGDCLAGDGPFDPASDSVDASMLMVLKRLMPLPSECRLFADDLESLAAEYR